MKLTFFRLSILVAALTATTFSGQTLSPVAEPDRPLPDISELMHEVEKHQRASEHIQKDYIYHEVVQQQRSDGKKAVTHEYDVFWLNGVEVQKLTRKDGKDLTAEEQRKEGERIDKEVAKAKERKTKAKTKGVETDSHGNEEITVSRFLELGNFTNPRRVKQNGRETIAIDYAGNPKAKTRNRMEDVIRDLSGTLWIDEQDRTITHLEGQFANSFKVGAGIVMSIKKGTSFSMDQIKINDEVWLPSRIEGHGSARVMLFVSFNGSILVTNSDYRKFKATSTILPGMSTVKDSSSGETNPSMNPGTTVPQH
ncbi:hypothetical protein [Edaphobacter albus]|uniref:hypothetical protein n=1 Tax=Edaphobacter sp. 4G125 TaxID=2763071 RepID=UPI0016496915|nr:hypothetical protein [Edaphobacter sp. 4G125]QNI36144.1 hypothetical protein H7846_14255 [Edaphobacter sp. 4G125]